MTLSVIIPVFNEAATLPVILERVLAQPFRLEVVVVDDGSTDGSGALLAAMCDPRVKVLRLDRNRGKGAAVAMGLSAATGDVIVVQDADLEYDPSDYPRLLEPLESGAARVVYGVRSWRRAPAGAWPRRAANWFMTRFANVLFGARLADLETCYKAFRRSAAEGLRLRSRRFGFDPEITAHFLRQRMQIIEVPISYTPRRRREGKKIRWTDFFVVLGTLVRCRFAPGGFQGLGRPAPAVVSCGRAEPRSQGAMSTGGAERSSRRARSRFSR